MRVSRKTFLRLSVAGAGAASALLHSRAGAAQTRSPKATKAAIKGTTDALTAFITNTTLNSMPPDVVQQAKRCLVDGFGVILAGSTVKGSAIVRDYVKTVGARKEATALGAGGFMTSASHAALINAASGHAMDYDDTQLSTTPDRTFGLLTHPTVPALSDMGVSGVVVSRLSPIVRPFGISYCTSSPLRLMSTSSVTAPHERV